MDGRRAGGQKGMDGRKGWMGTKAHACFSLLVSHGFVFMNGFALVALREIVLSSLPTASILSLRLSPQRGVEHCPSSGVRVALLQSEWKRAANRYFSQCSTTTQARTNSERRRWHLAKSRTKRNGGRTKHGIDICHKIINSITDE